MRLNLKYILATLLLSACLNANATHISEPILSEPTTEYRLGEKITLHGWVSYDNKPTADVLLAFKLTKSDTTIVTEASYHSNIDGQFLFEYPTNKLTPGKYLITVTSHCLEIHRSICTYKNKTLNIQIVE